TKEINSKQLVEKTIEAFGKIDILVNNVGAGNAENSITGFTLSKEDWNRAYTCGIADLTEDDWDRSYKANLKPTLFMCKAVIPYMRAKKSGKIINIASIGGRSGGLQRLPYSSMKSAVIIVTQGVAKQVARDNINVNCICPGIVYTAIFQSIEEIQLRTGARSQGAQDPRQAFLDRVQKMVPMGREQTPEDIGRLAVFLASEDSKNITGQSINVDGGIVMN
ncbi:MAG: SDR family NAD(P)-dependent oxidoreductase, partial [Dehalococcoidales bacterium]|nr:SDR family NAD(P)-dependent oxidoreductase [Dehalococcoidales bacterium]